jgi:hypothetical protein
MIFKLQRPLNWVTGLPTKEGDILAYNEDGSVTMAIRQNDDLLAMFDERPKIYVSARQEKGSLKITGIVDDCDW